MKRTDFIGLILAAACVVHCLAMPLVLVYLPMWGMSWLTDPNVHYVLLGAGMTLGGLSFLPGFRVHRRAWIPALALVGLGTMAYAAVFQEDACCRRPPANTVAEVMQTSLVPDEPSPSSSVVHEVGRAVPTAISNRQSAAVTARPTPLATTALVTSDSELPECCRTGHCSAAKGGLFQAVSAGVTSLGLTPYLPRSATPVGATLLLIAHILNLKFRGFRGCTADCCVEDEHSATDLAADASQVSKSARVTSPSDETTR